MDFFGVFIPRFVLVLLMTFGASICDAASRISIHGADCSGQSVEEVICDEAPEDSLWLIQTNERPQLSPKEALTLATTALATSDFGPYGFDILHRMIHLVPCGRGWIYIIEITATFSCDETAEPVTKTTNFAVFMDGQVIVPGRLLQLNGTTSDQENTGEP